MEYVNWFSERLAQLRMEKGISARDMSLSLGQSESYINKIENKRTLPSMTGFFNICDFLEIRPNDFFDSSSVSPTKTTEIMCEIKKLSSEKAEHVLQIVKDIVNAK